MADQVGDLVKVFRSMQAELQSKQLEMQQERDRYTASLAEAAAEAERAAMMHAEECKRQCEALETLELEENKLTGPVPSFRRNGEMRRMYISHNKLNSLSDGSDLPHALVRLVATHSGIVRVPEMLGSLHL